MLAPDPKVSYVSPAPHAPSAPRAGLDFTVLGEVRCRRAGTELHLGGPRQRALLAALVLGEGVPVGRDRLVEAVWGDTPVADGANLVQVHISKLRRLLDPDRAPRTGGGVLTRIGSSYRLAAEPGRSDLGRFRQLHAEARSLRSAGDPAAAERVLARALDCWQGAPLTGVDGPLFDVERARLNEMRLGAVEEYAELALETDAYADTVPLLVALTAEHPYRERLWALLMAALHRCGRRADALAAYRNVSRLLRDHLGLTPGCELRAAQEAVLGGTSRQRNGTRLRLVEESGAAAATRSTALTR